jgi:hypothetical protein
LSATTAVQEMIAILKGLAAGVISPDHIGFSGPAVAADLPTIAVALSATREAPVGIGGLAALSPSGAQWSTSTGTRTVGQMQIELWAAGIAAMNQLTPAILTLLDSSGATLAANGFTAFGTAAIRAAEGIQLPDSTGALHAVLEYSMVHDETSTAVSDPAGNIKEIDVTIDGQFNEQMTLK